MGFSSTLYVEVLPLMHPCISVALIQCHLIKVKAVGGKC